MSSISAKIRPRHSDDQLELIWTVSGAIPTPIPEGEDHLSVIFATEPGTPEQQELLSSAIDRMVAGEKLYMTSTRPPMSREVHEIVLSNGHFLFACGMDVPRFLEEQYHESILTTDGTIIIPISEGNPAS